MWELYPDYKLIKFQETHNTNLISYPNEVYNGQESMSNYKIFEN